MGLALALTIAFVLAIVLLIRGWIGQKIDDHPLCRRCGFDLSGRPQSSAVCSECGASLSSATIIIGHRQRRAGILSAGAALTVLTLIVTACALWQWAHDVDWITHYPVWWLLHEARVDLITPSPEVNELIERLNRDELSTRQISAITETALEVQAGPDSRWDNTWSDYLEQAHAKGKLTREQWTRYARQALHSLNMTLSLRPKVRICDPLPYHIELVPTRTGYNTLYESVGPVTFTINGKSMRRGDKVTPGNMVICGLNDNFAPSDLPANRQPGMLNVQGTVQLDVAETFNGPALFSELRAVTTSCTLLPATAQPLSIVPDNPSLRAALQRCIHVTRLTHSAQDIVELDVRFVSPPVGIAYRALVRTRSGTHPLMLDAALPRSGITYDKCFVGDNVPTDATADVILEPDPAIALKSTNVTEYFNGQFVFPNVPVTQLP